MGDRSSDWSAVVIVTNPEQEPPEPTPLAVRRRQAMEAARVVVTGNESNDIRRPVLYLIVGLALVGTGAGGWITYVAMALGIVALLLLLMSDPA